jgi:hypothetical protein
VCSLCVLVPSRRVTNLPEREEVNALAPVCGLLILCTLGLQVHMMLGNVIRETPLGTGAGGDRRGSKRIRASLSGSCENPPVGAAVATLPACCLGDKCQVPRTVARAVGGHASEWSTMLISTVCGMLME